MADRGGGFETAVGVVAVLVVGFILLKVVGFVLGALAFGIKLAVAAALVTVTLRLVSGAMDRRELRAGGSRKRLL